MQCCGRSGPGKVCPAIALVQLCCIEGTTCFALYGVGCDWDWLVACGGVLGLLKVAGFYWL